MAKKVDSAALDAEIVRLRTLGIADLRREWARLFKKPAPPALTKNLLGRMIAYRLQAQIFGGLDKKTQNLLDRLAHGKKPKDLPQRLKPGTVLVRDYQGTRHEVMIIREGFVWQGMTYTSLSAIAGQITGTTWNGRRFFGIDRLPAAYREGEQAPAPTRSATSVRAHDVEGAFLAPAAVADTARSAVIPANRSRQAQPSSSGGSRKGKPHPEIQPALAAAEAVEARP